MIEASPPAYTKAYWAEVADVLKSAHQAKPAEVRTAIAAYRDHMRPAGQTIYNRSPESVAKSIIAHGLIPSLPAVGAKLQLTFTLTEATAQESPRAAVSSFAELFAALDRIERAFGGGGFKTATPEPLPGLVLLTLTPFQALGAVERLAKVAAELDKASRQLTRADKELKAETASRAQAGVRVSAAVLYQPKCDSGECSR